MLLYSKNYPAIAYEAADGYICRTNHDGSFLRKLIPNENLMISIFVAELGKFTNRKQANIAWEILNKKSIPEGFVVYFKDMQPDNIKAHNLGLITKKDNVKIRDALQNLQSVLKITTDSKKAGCYKVRYKLHGRTLFAKFEDDIAAKQFKRKIQLESTKVLSQYFVTI